MAKFTMEKMAYGGIFDHIGWGYHRYSVTKDWHIPHYEKMLYDNAQLVCSLVDIFQSTKDELFKTRAEQVLKYAFLKLENPKGGFYCAEDADSIDPNDKESHHGKDEERP